MRIMRSNRPKRFTREGRYGRYGIIYIMMVCIIILYTNNIQSTLDSSKLASGLVKNFEFLSAKNNSNY